MPYQEKQTKEDEIENEAPSVGLSSSFSSFHSSKVGADPTVVNAFEEICCVSNNSVINYHYNSVINYHYNSVINYHYEYMLLQNIVNQTNTSKKRKTIVRISLVIIMMINYIINNHSLENQYAHHY